MKFIKKSLSSLFSCLLLNINFCGEANALFGYTHYNIGKKIIEKVDVNLSESEKTAFLSGMVYADIGRFKFDKDIKIESDSITFLEEMKKHTTTNEEKWFVLGIEMHILQDENTGKLLENVFQQKAWIISIMY